MTASTQRAQVGEQSWASLALLSKAPSVVATKKNEKHTHHGWLGLEVEHGNEHTTNPLDGNLRDQSRGFQGSTGVRRLVPLVPSPSWPLALPPQHLTEPVSCAPHSSAPALHRMPPAAYHLPPPTHV